MVLNLERAVLSSLIAAYDHDFIEYREVDPNVFIDDFHAWMARQINKAYAKNYPIPLLLDKIEETIKSHEWSNKYLEVLAATPYADWWKIYTHLKAKKIKRELARIVS